MVTRAEALQIVRERIAAMTEVTDLVVLEDETLEYDFGWVFFYNSEIYMRSGNISDALAGNAPFIVERSSGELFGTGTAKPIEAYIEAFRKFGDPHET